MVVEVEDAVDRPAGGRLVLEQVDLAQGVGLVPLEELREAARGLERYPLFVSTAQTVLRCTGWPLSAS